MDALLMRAAHYYSVQQIDDARADMATAQSMVAPYSVSARLIADQYSEYFDYRLALPIYEAWLKEHLDDAFRPTVLARVCFIDALFNQNLKAALKENSRLLKHAPDDPRILQSQAFLLMRLGSYSDAQSLFNKALSAANQKGWVWSDIGLAIIAKQNHDPEAASLALAHALKKVPRIIEIAQLYQLDLSDVPLPNLPQTP
jgi:tetratricopeptide (TPR) repeat protein